MQQDFLLIWKMKNGDEAAMDTFVRKYYTQILQYCLYHCPDREWAQDLTQETFERFFKRLGEYRHIGKEINYLYTIARNLCIDWYRQQKERNMTHVSEFENRSGDTDQMDEKLMLESALQKLPEELHEVVVLHYFQGLSLREVSAVLQIGVPLAKYRMRRAREKLREMLEDENNK